MKKKMKIIHIAHNPIFFDARVRKYIHTLGKNGLGHDVYSIGVNNQTNENEFLNLGEGEKKHEILDILNYRSRVLTNIKNSKKKLVKYFHLTLTGLILLSCTYLFFNHISFFSSTTNRNLILTLFIACSLYFVPKVSKFLSIKFNSFASIFFTKFISLFSYYKVISKSLSRYVDKDIDVIHVHDHIALIPVLLNKAKFKKVRVFWDAHELYFESKTYGTLISVFFNFFMQIYKKRIDCVFTISSSFKRIYKKKYFSRTPVHIVMNATIYNNETNSISTLIPNLIASNKKILLFQGGLGRNRGIEQLLKASKELTKDWVIVFMGNGILKDTIKSYEKKCHNIYHIPPVEQKNLKKWTSSATVGIIPYRNTSLNHFYCTPNKIWEYANAEIPIIATDLYEMGAIVKNNKLGITIDRNFCSKDITEAINKMDDEKIRFFKKNLNIFSKRNNWQKYEKIIRKAYEG